MANEEQVALLKQGSEVWNNWRDENPDVVIDLQSAKLHGANLGGTNLRRADFRDACLEEVDLSSAYLRSAILFGTNLQGANLLGADLQGANLLGADLRGANLSGARLQKATLFRASLYKADLTNARLSGADLRGTNLQNAKFCHADLCDVDFNLLGNFRTPPDQGNFRIPNNRVDFQNDDFYRANLQGADLSGAALRGADLYNVNLCDTNLRCADLYNASLRSSGLERANLEGADLHNANLYNANLQGANLERSKLLTAQVIKANFTNALLTGACIQDWQIASSTILDKVKCDYIFRTYDEENEQFTGRLPVDPDSKFAPGEFTHRFQIIASALETIDITFTEGIDWQAFFQSFQELRNSHPDEDISIQGMERKGHAFVVRLEVEAEADKGTRLSSSMLSNSSPSKPVTKSSCVYNRKKLPRIAKLNLLFSTLSKLWLKKTRFLRPFMAQLATSPRLITAKCRTSNTFMRPNNKT